MFNGLLSVAQSCESCGLDFSFADTGDGPAIFVMLFAGFFIVGLAAWVEIAYQPPYWMHALIFLPLSAIVCIGLLRPTKGLLIALQYYNLSLIHICCSVKPDSWHEFLGRKSLRCGVLPVCCCAAAIAPADGL